MEMGIRVAPARAQLGKTNQSHRAKRMQDHQRNKWAFRIAMTLGLILGTGWGFLLGVALVRLNTIFAFAGMLLTALPAAFIGGVPVAFAFHRLMPNWHRAASLLVIFIFVAVGMPLGLAYGVLERQIDPAQFVNTTGDLIWYLEWFSAFLGLVGGTWPGWMRPITERGGNLTLSVLAGPIALVRFIVSIPGRMLEAIARFFETVGRGFLWLPLQLLKAVNGTFENARERWVHFQAPAPAAPALPPPDAAPVPTPAPASRAGETKRRRARMPKMLSRRRSNDVEGPRIVDVVEDRCPYCFDVVKRKDPRGVKVCEVCGTPHHADCWAITGKCQVPHLNT